jgi:hypothetical protein
MLSSVITGVYELSGLPPFEGDAQPFTIAARQPKLSSLKAAGNKSLICPFISDHQDFDGFKHAATLSSVAFLWFDALIMLQEGIGSERAWGP